MIEVILSPDLRLRERIEAARAVRISCVDKFTIGDTVQAGPRGAPGVLKGISEDGFASILWPDGSVLSGVAADELVRPTSD